MKNFSFYLAFSLFSFTALAGNGGRTVGNGGDVLKCAVDNVESYQILDWYEGQSLRSLSLNLGEETLTTNEKLNIALDRLERVSPFRAERYKKHLESFFSETKWLTNGVLSDISDSDHIAIPDGCKILQIANQSSPILNSDKRYLIDKGLWEKLNNGQQATLLLHEVILREALEIGHLNSVSTRYLNSLILSENIEQLTIAEFTSILKKLGFHETSVEGVRIKLEDFEFHSNGKLHFAQVADGAILNWEGNFISLQGKIMFNQKGKVLEFTPNKTFELHYQNSTFSVMPFPVKFYDNGKIESFILNSPTSLKFNGHELRVKGAVKFYESGLLKVAIVEDGVISLISLSKNPLPINSVIKFHESGGLQQANILASYKLPLKFPLICRGEIHLDPNAVPTFVYLESEGEVVVQGKTLKLAPFSSLEFWAATGYLKKATVSQVTYLLNKSNQRIKIEAKSTFKLDEAGFLLN